MPHRNSLFERLECEGSSRTCGVMSVAAHLGKMLSTRAGSVQTLPDYGLPDLNDMRLSLHESLSRSRLLIERFIRAYEPRLANVHVRVSPLAREPLALAFAIEAEMAIDGVNQAVVFHARLDDAGRVEVGTDGF
ncbi:type VI secretion system baseplate subunit TssE [Pseudomonas sp. SIMBA_059]|uniref:type VI secretion system baseplate subunit TssE n=1 Tax=Pseudomonas palleroniana TaxID=191390 RepID=UPI0018E6C354|nr:type VI secretion system baseplate subunit TssE [Pseudomonas palleroniana]MBI6911123.1 type VI secretion system baseplate subunit TssE [Pseudomonas palleroniana]